MMNLVSKWLPVVARVLFALIFVVFGANGFLNFLPAQPAPPPAAAAFVGGLFSASYFLVLLKGTEVVAGLLLLANRAVPFALVLIAPIVVNIAAFHFLLAPEGAPLAVIVVALQAYLAWVNRAAFAPLFTRSREPSSSEKPARGVRAALA